MLNNRFHILRTLGEGGQGRAYLAEDLQSARQVVVKELIMGQAADWKAMELFERESAILRNLEHPAIPAYVDGFYLDEGTRIFLVQEFVQGQNLEDIVARGELFDEERLRDFLGQLLEILAYLQSFSPPVIHRDIKPSNILVDADGRYHLVDFGAVQLIVQDNVGGSTIVGTSGFMPPEQLIGRAGPASDIYSLGATCVQLASGIEPGDLPMVRMKLAFRDVLDLDPFLLDLLERMLEPASDQRFANAASVQAALVTGVISTGLSAKPAAIGSFSPDAPGFSKLRQMLANPPNRVEFDEFELLADGTLRVAIVSRRPMGLKGLGLMWLFGGALFMVGMLTTYTTPCCVAIPIMMLSAAMTLISLVRGHWLDVDQLELSAQQVIISRCSQRGVRAPRLVLRQQVISLREVTSCYLYLLDNSRAPGSDAENSSSINTAHNYPGIYFVTTDGEDRRLDLGALFKRKYTSGAITPLRRVLFGEGARADSVSANAYDAQAQARWFYEIVQEYLQAVTSRPERAKTAAPTEVVLGLAAADAREVSGAGSAEHRAEAWATVTDDGESKSGD